MKKQELFDDVLQKPRYNIYIKGEKRFSALSDDQLFDLLEDLAIEFYQTGSPDPNEIYTEILRD